MSDISPDAADEYTSLLNRRRASHTFLDTPIGSFRGPNSLHNFASSFTRAQSFAASKIDNEIHRQRSFLITDSASPNEGVIDDELFDPELMMPSYRGQRLSTVIHDISNKNQMFLSSPVVSDLASSNDVFYHDEVINSINANSSKHHPAGIPITNKKFLPSQSFSSFRSAISQATTSSHFNVKKIEDKDGNVVTVLQGQSTAPQTIFNSVNILIGVGLLALPVGILKAGWVLGIPYLLICGLSTCWTATLISKIMDTDSTIMTYADLGYAAYGSVAKLIISFIFCADLIGAGIALVVLFSDSLFALLGDEVWTKTRFKILAFFILTPFTFLPLPILSIFSLFGIISTISITFLVLFCGVIKPDSPGSLLSVMPVNMWPQSIPDLLLAIGILLSPFGGHAIFPNLKTDMRHPHKFTKTLKVTYTITILTDFSMGVLGFLMFGNLCSDEITNNLLLTPGYPSWLYPTISGLICMIPLAKTALNAKPIISTLDSITHVNTKSESFFLNNFKGLGRIINRIGVNMIFVALAILFPLFDKIMGMLGASIGFLVCIILPCSFYLKLCGNNVRFTERILVTFAILVSMVLGVVGTFAVIAY